MDLEEFLGQENTNNFEKLLLVYLQFRSFKSYKDLEPVFKVSGVTIRKAIANLRKLGLLNNYEPVKLSFRCKEIFTHENEECKESFTYKNDTCKENLTPCKEMFTSDSDRCKENFTTCKENFTSEKNSSLSINTNNNINKINSINSGKLSLTSFASASLEDYTVKNNFVNDPDHKDLNQIKKDQTTNNQNFELSPLSESLPAPAKQKKPKKIKAQFIPPTAQDVALYMQEYVEKEKEETPKLLTIDVKILSKIFIATYSDDWSVVKNWKNKSISWLYREIGASRTQKGYTTKRRKNQDAIEEIFGKGLEPETNIIDAVQTENADGSVSYDASLTNQIQPAEEAELSADEYIRRFKKGEIK